MSVEERLATAHRRACRYRLQRVADQLRFQGIDAILLYDPVNIRYATDSRNMQVWALHNRVRYALVSADAYVVMWEFHGSEHLLDNNDQVDEIRSAIGSDYLAAGPRGDKRRRVWAKDVAAVAARLGIQSLAMDSAVHAEHTLLEDAGLNVFDGESIMQHARAIKSDDELQLMRHAMRVCERSMRRMYDELRPGLTEQELWAWLHFENIRHGGEWIETRLLVSGPRTNPWMREASGRVLREGELLCFDTDLIGPYGYCADVSRTWTVGHVAPSVAQRELYCAAFEQIQHNAALVKPGMSFRDVSENAWPIPDRYYSHRYCLLMHGVGMADEYPGLSHAGQDWQASGYDGEFAENMVLSVESFVGEVGGREGVKLEQQYRLTADGMQPMCDFPFNQEWLVAPAV